MSGLQQQRRQRQNWRAGSGRVELRGVPQTRHAMSGINQVSSDDAGWRFAQCFGDKVSPPLTDDVGFCDVLDFALSRVCERMVSMPSRVKTRCALFPLRAGRTAHSESLHD
jgi:hypothetical protein